MAVKFVQVLLDDFTSKSLAYDNVEVYDYGIYSDYTSYDDYYYDWYNDPAVSFDFGDIDNEILNFRSYGYFNTDEFFGLTSYDFGTSEASWSEYNSTYGLYRYEDYYDYLGTEELVPYASSYDEIGHGDWVLDAFMGQMSNPADVEVLAIDYDFTSREDFNYLFQDNSSDAGIQNGFFGILAIF